MSFYLQRQHYSVYLSLDVEVVLLTNWTDAALPVIEQCVGSRHNK